MKTKLEMAHEWYMMQTRRNGCALVADAWKYADAMQAAADEREKEDAAQRRKEIREMLNAPNTFVEREGQHFDDVYGCEVDWRVAPKWAKYWAVREDSDTALWCINKPTVTGDCFFISWRL